MNIHFGSFSNNKSKFFLINELHLSLFKTNNSSILHTVLYKIVYILILIRILLFNLFLLN